MLASMSYRGTQATSVYMSEDGRVGLGQLQSGAFGGRRETPGFIAADDVAIAVDGQVLNADDLLRDFPTEANAASKEALAVLAAYRQSGEGFVTKLDGPFSVALWDNRARKLILTRDRMGETPLYYQYDPASQAIRFASEVKSLLACPGVETKLDEQGLGLYFNFGYTPGPGTLFSGIRKLLQGELLVFDDSGEVERRRYWQMPSLNDDADEEELSGSETKEIFLQSLNAYRNGSQDVGVFLSGGIDSSIIVAGLRELGVENIHTFAFGINDPRYKQRSEDLGYARIVSEFFGTTHHELVLSPGRELSPDLTRIVYQFDDLLMTPNIYSKYLMAKEVRNASLTSMFTGLGSGLAITTWKPGKLEKTRAKIADCKTDAERFYRLRARLFSLDEQKDIMREPPQVEKERIFSILNECFGDLRRDERAEYYPWRRFYAVTVQSEKDIKGWERAGALASIEVRSPYMSTNLTEFGSRMPKTPGGEAFLSVKGQLMKAYSRTLPREVFERRVIGYPAYYWNKGELDDYQQRLFRPERLVDHPVLQPDGVNRVLEAERQVQKKSGGRMSWMLTQFALWHELHIQGRTAEWGLS